MRSGCRPRTRRSRAAATRSPGRCRTSTTCAASSGRWARPSTGSTRSSPADPAYYMWNQWLFLRLLEAGLAYRALSSVDWCPNDGTLAREQVEGADRHCWRCGALVEKRDLEQWFLRTTAVRRRAARFLGPRLARAGADHADELDRPVGGRRDRVRGRSPTNTASAATGCACSRPGPTRCSARRSWSSRRSTRSSRALTAPDRRAEVDAYVEQARRRTEIDRLSTDREKTGVATGSDADQPGQRRADPDLRRRLRPGRLRHRRDHGGPRPR